MYKEPLVDDKTNAEFKKRIELELKKVSEKLGNPELSDADFFDNLHEACFLNRMADSHDNIPYKTMEALVLWADYGIQPGGFLRAVLNNDLFTAIGRADHDCLPALPMIVSYIYRELPGDCHGSPIACDIWEIKKRTERAKKERLGP